MKENNYRKKFYLSNSDVMVELKDSIPEKFYKYIGVNKRSIQNLKNTTIHFSHPFKLNDLMEGNSFFWDLEEYLNQYHKETNNSKEKMFKFLTQDFLEDYFTHRGVLCFATEYNNNLFWPHYTNEEGICIEFDTKIFLDSFSSENYILFPIDYDDLKKINFKDYILEQTFGNKKYVDVNLPAIFTLSVKDSIWSYENEWRMIIKKQNLGKVSHPLRIINDENYKSEVENLSRRNLKYERKAINKIILSVLFFNHKRFNKIEENDLCNTYYFREFDENLYNLLNDLYNNYNDLIFQIDKDSDYKNKIVSKVNYKLEIKELTDSFVKITRKKMIE